MSNIKLAARLDAITESATLALNARALRLASEGQKIYNLTAGELATETPSFIQSAVKKKIELNKYTPVAGLPELRQSIAENMAKFYNLDWIKAENVVVTSGAKPALYTSLLSIIDPGDEVILPVPAWTTTYQPLVELAGGKLIEVQLENNFDLNIQNIFEAMTVRTKAIIINSPHNPTGAIFSKEALTRLADYVRGKNIVIIADDIYSKLIYDKSFFPVSSCDFENLIIINGFSKSQALTGWRVGYLIAELSVAKATTSLLSHITGNAAVLSQYAALEAMKRHDMPPASTLKTLKLQRQLVLDGLDGCGIAHNIPGGAFYIFLDLRPFTIDSVAWCERLLNETGVAIVPGEAFSAPGYARMSFVADEMTLKVALDKINHYIKKKGQV